MPKTIRNAAVLNQKGSPPDFGQFGQQWTLRFTHAIGAGVSERVSCLKEIVELVDWAGVWP
jgi:hypothetical protein